MNQQNLYTDLSDIPLRITIKSGDLLSQSLRCSRFRIYSQQDDVCNAEALVYFSEINQITVNGEIIGEIIDPAEYSTFHDTQSQVWQIDSPPLRNYISDPSGLSNPPGLIFRLTRIN